MNMIEKVARALCIEVGNISYDDLPESATYLERKTHVDRPMLDRQEAREVAKVVIEAMRTAPAAWAWKGPQGGFIADDKKPAWPSTPLYSLEGGDALDQEAADPASE